MIKRKGISKKQEKIVIVGFLLTVVWICLFFPRVYLTDATIHEANVNKYALEQTIDGEVPVRENGDSFVYLSDIDYVASQSRPGWGTILKDTTSAGSKISVKIEGAYYSFDKGMWAHATSQLVYDIRDYDYDYFTSYIGLNQTAASSSNGVKFYIYTSMDGSTWELQTSENPTILTPGMDAEFVKISIKDVNYLKLVADSNGPNGNDHSVYADAKLIKESYKEPGEELLPSLSELDTKIKKFVSEGADLSTNKEYELTLLKRELVSKMGNYALKKYLGESEENRNLYRWLTGDVDILRLFVLGGTPSGGNYYSALSILTRLYEEYSTDFINTELLGNPTTPEMTYGDLYKKMAMSIALTHTQNIGLWMNSTREENKSEPLRRYAIFKYLYKNGGMRIADSMDMTHLFEDLHIQEMRILLSNNIDDEEILWLNRYVQDNVDKNPGNIWRYTTPHPYIAYVWPNYANAVYYAPENVDYFNELFAINKTENNVGSPLYNAGALNVGKVGMFDSEFLIPGGKNISEYRLKITRGTPENQVYKVWMNFRNKFGTGAVCGGISKSGANIRGTHGIPAMVIGQPGHAALLFYSKDAEGRGYWRIDNDVSGWTLSGGGGNLLGWGSGSYTQGFSNGVYVEFEQAAINDYANFIKVEEQIMLANVYKSELTNETIDEATKQNSLQKQEEFYRNALTIQSINYDAWLGLIDVYNRNEAKTENEFYDLAENIANTLKHFPLPMYNATNLIKPKLKNVENIYKLTLLQTRTLTEASQLPNNTTTDFSVVQPGVTRLEASFLLGKMDKTIATFSFDGEDAGKIVLSDRFDGNGVRWDYSLDGKQTWKEVSFTAEEEHKLQLTSEELASITSTNDIYVHIVGVNYEEQNLYSIDITEQTLPAILYANDLENRVMGVDLTYEWRNNENDAWTSYKTASPDNTGNKELEIRIGATGTRLASGSRKFTFTEDNQLDTQKYVRISHLSIHDYSTQSVDSKRPYYAPNAIDGNVNTLWHTDFRYNVLQQEGKPFITIKLDHPTYLSVLEFTQKKYKSNDPDAIKNGIVYVSQDGESFKEVGRIENCENYDETHRVVFNESVYGQYVKLELETYDMFASVAMISLFEDRTKQDVEVPTAGIAYDKTTLTNGNVVVRLVNPSTNITILNNGGSDTYVCTYNECTFTFEFEDDNGVKGTATAYVDWIDKESPTAEVTYSTTTPTNKDVTANLTNIKEDVYLLDENNNKVNSIELENGRVVSIHYLDLQGNITKVLYLNEKGDTEKITYYYNTENKDTILYTVTLNELGNVIKETFKDEDGNVIDPENKEDIRRLDLMGRTKPLQYTFEENGTYTFRLEDKAGNRNDVVARVDFIDRVVPIAFVHYDVMETTVGRVVATIAFDKTGVRITNNGGSDTYTFTENGSFTFTFVDQAGNSGSTTAKVDWIEKQEFPVVSLHYSEEMQTKNPVSVMLVNQGSPIKILNNGGSNVYTFEKNGEFTFEYEDLAGNFYTITARVSWIIQEENSNENENNQGNTNGENNTNTSGSGNGFSSSTNKPTASHPIISVPVDKDDTINNTIPNTNPTDKTEEKEDSNQVQEDKNENKNQNDVKNEEIKQEEKNSKKKLTFIGMICFIIVVAILRIKIHKK